MDEEDPFSPMVVSQYQVALDIAASQGIRVRMLLIINPHNPLGSAISSRWSTSAICLLFLGRCYSASTLRALMDFCQRNNIHMVSDEVYGLSVYDTGSGDNTIDFTSVLSIDSRRLIDSDRLHVLYGMSKASPCEARTQMIRVLTFNVGLWSCWTSSRLPHHPKCRLT